MDDPDNGKNRVFALTIVGLHLFLVVCMGFYSAFEFGPGGGSMEDVEFRVEWISSRGGISYTDDPMNTTLKDVSITIHYTIRNHGKEPVRVPEPYNARGVTFRVRTPDGNIAQYHGAGLDYMTPWITLEPHDFFYANLTIEELFWEVTDVWGKNLGQLEFEPGTYEIYGELGDGLATTDLFKVTIRDPSEMVSSDSYYNDFVIPWP